MFTILKLSDNIRIRTSAQIINPLPDITSNFAVVPKENIIKKLMIDPNLVKGDIMLIESDYELSQELSNLYVGVVDLVIGNILHCNANFGTRPKNMNKFLNIPRISYDIKGDEIIIGKISITSYRKVMKLPLFDIPREIKDQLLEVDYVIGQGINKYLTKYNTESTKAQTEEIIPKLVDFIIRFEDLAKEFTELKEVLVNKGKQMDPTPQ